MADATQPGAPLTWHRVCGLDEIPPRGARTIEVRGRSIAVFRTSVDGVFALLDRCPHRGGPLSQGIVHGNCVTCPLHDWVIDLATGEARAPDEGKTESFRVGIEGDDVVLGLSETSTGDAAPAARSSAEARAAVAR